MSNDDKILTEDFVNNELHWWNIPGVTIGICQGGKTLQAEGFGYRNVAQKLPMTADTLGGIASCSKSFCAAVIASLVDEGVLDFDRPVHDYLPELEFMDPAATNECTLRDMLYHRTGLAGHDAMWPDASITRNEYLHRIRFLEPNVPFRYKSQYSNTIYNLAGIVAEEVTGVRYEDLVQKRILDPLGMKHTTLSVYAMRRTDNWAAGYLERIVRPEADRSRTDTWLSGLEEMPGWEMNVGVPAAGVNSCPTDMLKWITLHLQNGIYEGKRILSRHVCEEMHTPAVVMSAFPWKFPEVPGIGEYGMAWKTTVYRGLAMRYHCGEIEGYSSIECFLPDQDFGMFVLCNHHAPVTPFLLELVYTAIDRALGLSYIDWAERLHPYLNNNSGSCEGWKLDLCKDIDNKDAYSVSSFTHTGNTPQAHAGSVADISPAAFSHGNAECVGEYRSEAYGIYRIREENGRLFLSYKQWLLPLEHMAGSLFRVPELKEDTLFIDMPLRFVEEKESRQNNSSFPADSHADDNKITGFTLRLEQSVAPIYFQKL